MKIKGLKRETERLDCELVICLFIDGTLHSFISQRSPEATPIRHYTYQSSVALPFYQLMAYTKVTLFYNEVTLFYHKVTLLYNKVTLFYNKVTLFYNKVTLYLYACSCRGPLLAPR